MLVLPRGHVDSHQEPPRPLYTARCQGSCARVDQGTTRGTVRRHDGSQCSGMPLWKCLQKLGIRSFLKSKVELLRMWNSGLF